MQCTKLSVVPTRYAEQQKVYFNDNQHILHLSPYKILEVHTHKKHQCWSWSR